MGSFLPLHNKALFAISEITDGSMRTINGTYLRGQQNRERFVASIGRDPNSLVVAGIDHGPLLSVVSRERCGDVIPSVDGFFTTDPQVTLGVTAADCPSVAMYAPSVGVIGLFHAGWRGLSLGIVPTAVRVLKYSYNVDMAEVWASIGPGVRPCHYRVSPEHAALFASWPAAVSMTAHGPTLDLAAVVRAQLLEFGAKEDHIIHDPRCTFEHVDTMFSYRRDKHIVPQWGAMLAVAALR